MISLITDSAKVGRIIHHRVLTFPADKPPPYHGAYQELLLTAGISANIFLNLPSDQGAGPADFPMRQGLV